MKIYTPRELNAMAPEERKIALNGEFHRSFHRGAAEHVTWIFWTRETSAPTEVLGQGSAFILDRGSGPMLITAAHVYRQFLADAERHGPLYCQVSNTRVKNLSGLLVACGNLDTPLGEPEREPDIATFRMPTGAVLRVGKKPILAPSKEWPPPPKVGENVLFVGLPWTGATDHRTERDELWLPFRNDRGDVDHRPSDCMQVRTRILDRRAWPWAAAAWIWPRRDQRGSVARSGLS